VLTARFSAAWLHFEPRQRELRPHHVRARKQRSTDRGHPRFEIARAGDHERPRALRGQHRVDQEERHAATVIAMQVREDDRVEGVGVDPLLLERDE